MLEIYSFLILINCWLIIKYNLYRYVIVNIDLRIPFWHGVDRYKMVIIMMHIGCETNVQSEWNAYFLIFHRLFVEFHIFDQLWVNNPEHLATGR